MCFCVILCCGCWCGGGSDDDCTAHLPPSPPHDGVVFRSLCLCSYSCLCACEMHFVCLTPRRDINDEQLSDRKSKSRYPRVPVACTRARGISTQTRAQTRIQHSPLFDSVLFTTYSWRPRLLRRKCQFSCPSGFRFSHWAPHCPALHLVKRVFIHLPSRPFQQARARPQRGAAYCTDEHRFDTLGYKKNLASTRLLRCNIAR